MGSIDETTISNSRLWYKEAAKDWNEALPIGNGRIGGMVYGGISKEEVQLNEESIWYGKRKDRNNPDALSHLQQIRDLLFEGKVREAERLAVMTLSGVPEGQSHYQPLGNLFLHFDYEEDEIENYYRELDINKAIAKVTYSINDTTYTREYFSSAVDQVMIVQITADKPKSISFNATLGRSKYMDKKGKASADTIEMEGTTGGEEAIKFCTMVRAIAKGGSTYALGENLIVEQADRVTLVLSARTNFRYKDPKQQCRIDLDKVAQRTYERIWEDHIKEYEIFFYRMDIQLGNGSKDETIGTFSTKERLDRVKEGKDDPELVSQYFQFGRYLLISSSRPGTLPANLQGIWNKDMLPPWDSKYTININTEMNYWPAETCNLGDCHQPLFDLIERMREPGRHTAKVMYNCGGFAAHHNTDIWGDTAPQDIYIPATYWPMGAAWLCLHLWEHYEFSRDKEFLIKAYDTMKEAAEFFLDYLIEDQKGRLVTCPSVSPENTFRLENGEEGCLCIGPSMDSQIIHALFNDCVQGAEILGKDQEFSEKLQEVIKKLPKPQIGRYGQIQEWAEDYEEVEPGHRHISHLFALHPGNQITVTKTPELAVAARKTLERRLSHGGGHTGWSRAWIINMWARLEDGEKAYENVLALLQKSTLPNLFDNHPPFQIDGNFGGTAGIAEMLLQSHAGEIHLLPALPKVWTEGCIRGIRARGGAELDIEWTEGKLDKVIIKAYCTNLYSIKYGNKQISIPMENGEVIILDGGLQTTEQKKNHFL